MSVDGVSEMRRLVRSAAKTAVFQTRQPHPGLAFARSTQSDASTSVDECLRAFVNHEKSGVPKGAGTDTEDGFDLGRMRRLLADIGAPQTAYNTIHVSGTKGKGTTIAVLASILRASGTRVGTYKSPHVYTVAERIRVNDETSSDKVLNLLKELEARINLAQERENGNLSYFEVLTALAYAHFAREKIDLALVEVGLGGSRDATNVLSPENLEAAVVTHVGEEHLDALGGSIEGIVEAKAGIAHAERPVFVAPNVDSRVNRLLIQALRSRKANIVDQVRADVRLVGYTDKNDDGSVLAQRVDVDIKMDGKVDATLNGVKVPLLGPHQRENISLALRVLWWLRSQGSIKVSVDDIRTGLESTYSPGNFEKFAAPVPGVELIADGAHTTGSARVLVETLREVYPGHEFSFVVAMADDKDHGGFLRELCEAKPVSIVCTQMEVAGGSSRTTEAKLLADAFDPSWSAPTPEVVVNFDEALRKACERSDAKTVVVVTGSLYTFKALKKSLLV